MDHPITNKRPNEDDPQAEKRMRPNPTDVGSNQNVSPAPKYEYISLEGVSLKYPITTPTLMVNVYGIIVEYRDKENGEKELLIKDETTNAFTVRVKATDKYLQKGEWVMDELFFVPGDIIRIRRLTLRQSNFERKCHWVRNIVTFNPLRKKLFTPTSLEPNEVFESIDHTRVSDLTKWSSLNLLRPTVKRFPNGNYFTVDAAFQVLYRFELNPEKGKTPACTVFICINGYPLVDFPTQDKYGLTWYGFMKHFHNLKASTSHPTRHLVNYQWEDVQRMYHKNEFITISAFGEKAALAVKPLDIIVIHNLLIKPDRSAKSNYSYLAYDPINCNMPVRKSLRIAHPESLLAVALQKQILQYSYSWTLPPAVSSFDELKEQIEATGYRTDETDIESDDEAFH